MFGWVKIPSGQAKTKFRGRRRVDASFTLSLAAYKNLIVPIPGGIQGQPLFPTEQEAEQCQIRRLVTEDELLKA